MIKINLAPTVVFGSSQASVSNLSGSNDGFLTDAELRKESFKRLAIVFILPAALYAYQQQNVPEKIAQLNQKSKALAEMKAFNETNSGSVAEIKKFKEDQDKIEKRINALDKISKDRQREIQVLDLFQQVIPEKAWLTKLEVQPDKVIATGISLTDAEISTFMEALTKSAFLMDVNLVNSSEVNVDNMSLKKFEISCLLEKPR